MYQGRGSGRTTKMLRLAADEAVRGNRAYVVMATDYEFTHAVLIINREYAKLGVVWRNASKSLSFDATAGCLQFVTMNNRNINWETIPPTIFGDRAPVFVDHHVFDLRLKDTLLDGPNHRYNGRYQSSISLYGSR
jgi:hypothetical protein